MFLRALLKGVIWEIWKERNQRIFEDRKREVSRVVNSILVEVCLWLMVTKEFQDGVRMDFMRDWVTCISYALHGNGMISKKWVPPPFGRYKLNFEGADQLDLGVLLGIAKGMLSRFVAVLLGAVILRKLRW